MPFSHESINFVRHENRYEFLWVRVIASPYTNRQVPQVTCNRSNKKVRHFTKNEMMNIFLKNDEISFISTKQISNP